MDPRLFATVFTTIFVAELGDKTQLATVLYAADGAHPRWTIFFASAAALIASTGLAVFAGSFLSELVEPRPLRRLAGFGFIAVGIWVLIARE